MLRAKVLKKVNFVFLFLCILWQYFEPSVPPSSWHLTSMRQTDGLRLCFTQIGLNKCTFWTYSVNITTFIVLLLVKAIVPIMCMAFQPTKSKTFELWLLFLSQCVASTPAFVPAMCFLTSLLLSEWTQHSKHCALVYLLQHVSVKIRRTHINPYPTNVENRVSS